MSDPSINSPSIQLTQLDARRIASHAAAADAARWLHPVQQALLHRRGWLKMLAPRSLGGAELALPAAVRLEEAIARVDGSLAWIVTLCAGAGWFAGFLAPALAREIVSTRRLCLAGSGAPTGYADADGDGWRIGGRWDYASGAPMATHFTLNAVLRQNGQALTDASGAPRIRAFVVPARQVQVLPSWRSIGLRATASHSYRIDGQWVAGEHGFDIDAAHGTAQGPLYRFPFFGLAFVTLAANVAGMAWHFMQLARPFIARRRHPVRNMALADTPELAQRLASLEQGFEAARTHFYRLLDGSWEQVAAGHALAAQASAALQTASLALVAVSRQAVDELYPYCGLGAAHEESEINRVWRDLHTATQHALLLP
ncbi:MAG TPA: acyl-CoA dehydrogenase [Janthinobacterium sp.]|jgi:alkylation response protein AidB-like acyl-CoA dehydrogenase|nr:acyl-CoA dehydrogenase [Janthinobacterium sp.]